MKAKGLQKLRFYCQMCEKQCRDANGFKCHCLSESHQRQMALFADDPSKYLETFSQTFQEEYVALLARRYNTQRVAANQVYQELIADRHHLHMNATKWDTLTDFVKHLGREGIARVDETPRGWFVAWVDNSPEALERQAAVLKKERGSLSDEQREQRLLQEQIERARQAAGSDTEKDVYTELHRGDPEAKITLALRLTGKSTDSGASSVVVTPTDAAKRDDNPMAPSSAEGTAVASVSTTLTATKFKFGTTTKPFKKPVLNKGGLKALVQNKDKSESLKPATTKIPVGGSMKRKSALESIMEMEQARKAARG
ncbi:hypothetical protein IWQ60_005246 [Tieghemiomyces parasiticus]|uniref:C2H2-type domain-containing protein n=1 Tax=Tieghemiomyces parasiticus TaxID=78921 RepID=A0A9W8A6N3_9FUNG|nr:hypothetical protein IWQ60_005246 [Tieghemiomyces parasiticus]